MEEPDAMLLYCVGWIFSFFIFTKKQRERKNKKNDQPFNNPKREKAVKLPSFVEQRECYIPCMQPTSWDRWRQCRPTPDTTTKGGEGRATTSP
jgi:hypothetical protein